MGNDKKSQLIMSFEKWLDWRIQLAEDAFKYQKPGSHTYIRIEARLDSFREVKKKLDLERLASTEKPNKGPNLLSTLKNWAFAPVPVQIFACNCGGEGREYRDKKTKEVRFYCSYCERGTAYFPPDGIKEAKEAWSEIIKQSVPPGKGFMFKAGLFEGEGCYPNKEDHKERLFGSPPDIEPKPMKLPKLKVLEKNRNAKRCTVIGIVRDRKSSGTRVFNLSCGYQLKLGPSVAIGDLVVCPYCSGFAKGTKTERLDSSKPNPVQPPRTLPVKEYDKIIIEAVEKDK